EEGYGYAQKREELKERKKELEERRDELRDEVQDYMDHLIPFTFAPQLLKKLLRELKQDKGRASNKAITQFADELSEDQLKNVAQKSDELTEEFPDTKLVKLVSAEGDKEVIHPVSDQDRQEMIYWISELIPDKAEEFTQVTDELTELEEELAHTRDMITRVPDEEVIQPYVE
ncbi:MAG: hypothetical protein ABEH43_06805, partial [Flavobacteriales bacterium]